LNGGVMREAGQMKEAREIRRRKEVQGENHCDRHDSKLTYNGRAQK
jgi:hypothetical protein